MILLPAHMFDDGSLECKNFCVVTVDKDGYEDALVCEYYYIKKNYPLYISRIEKANTEGKHYIGCGRAAVPSEYFEIQWD